MILRTYLKLLFSSLSNRANWLCINKTLMHYYINALLHKSDEFGHN